MTDLGARRTVGPLLEQAGIGRTPLLSVVTPFHGRTRRVLLKLESCNPTGSVKDRTAAGLLAAMDRWAPLTPGTTVVESTSGNLGLAMAHLLNELGCRFVAVVDPRTPESTLRLLRAAKAELVLVDEPDGRGGYLLSRLRRVRELCDANPGYRWSDQYHQRANPAVHQVTTGPEIADQAGPELDAVYVAVSTGGTLAGVSAHLRTLGRRIRIVAVDAQGSCVTGGCPGPRLITGIGASRSSTFLGPGAYDQAVRVRDVDAFATCRVLWADTGLHLGGSSGSVLFACLEAATGPDPPRLPLCLCPDGGDRYRDTLYDDAWLAGKHALAGVLRSIDRLRAGGLAFRLGA